MRNQSPPTMYTKFLSFPTLGLINTLSHQVTIIRLGLLLCKVHNRSSGLTASATGALIAISIVLERIVIEQQVSGPSLSQASRELDPLDCPRKKIGRRD